MGWGEHSIFLFIIKGEEIGRSYNEAGKGVPRLLDCFLLMSGGINISGDLRQLGCWPSSGEQAVSLTVQGLQARKV